MSDASLYEQLAKAKADAAEWERQWNDSQEENAQLLRELAPHRRRVSDQNTADRWSDAY